MGASRRASQVPGVLFLAVGALLAGCGGGGDGGGGGGGGTTPVAYTGSTSAAVVSTTNASALTANVVGGDSGVVSGALAVTGEIEATRGRVELAQRLSRRMREGMQLVGPDAKAAAGLQVNQTDPCDNGVGTVHTTGTINDFTGTGTLTFAYSGCLIGSDTFDGVATFRIDAFDGSFFTDTTTTYGRLNVRGPGLSVDVSGTLRSQLNVGASMETVTEDLVTLNNLTGLLSKSENLVYVYVYDNFFSPNSYTAQVNGRLYHQVHGYVDIATNVPLDFDSLSQVFPGSGQLTMTGSAGGAIRVVGMSISFARLELDLDANGIFEIVARLSWSDLSGPVGSDLGDSDGDSMHNSWETEYGLDPNNAADATSDADGDGSQAQEEYFAGSRPDDATSKPSGVGLSVTITDFPDPVVVGMNLTYTISVTNSSAVAANGVELTDTLPAGVTFVSATPGQGGCSGTTTVTCLLGTVGAFSTVSVTIVVTATAEGALSNSVSVTSSTPDNDPGDNSATATTTVNPQLANLAVTVMDSPDPAFVGGILTYTVGVSNPADFPAQNVVVTGTLPAGVTLQSATPDQGICTGTSTLTCSLGTVAVYSTSFITIVVGLPSEGVFTFTVSGTTTTADANPSNNTATASTTVGQPAAGIQGMIDVASDGDTISVPAGIYAGGIDFKGKNVTLQSQSGPAVTIINGAGGTGVKIGPNGTIRGFTITGSVAYFGAGMEVSGTGTVIAGNVFDGNVQLSGGHGAAIGGNSASPIIEGNVFRNHTCDSQFSAGVVAFVNFSSPRIVNNIFANNPCQAINLHGPVGTAPQVLNNTIVGNRVGIRVNRNVSRVLHVFRNNIVVQNSVGAQFDSGTDADNPVWTNNLVFGNTTDYSGTIDQTGTNGNLSADPMFVNAATGNYRLQTSSPAINAGSPADAPAVDFDGTARPQGAAVDIGAFEAVP